MKKKNLTGIVTIVSVVTLILLALTIRSQAEAVKAFYVKLAMTNMAVTIAMAGIYITDVFTKDIARIMKLVIWSLGGFFILYTALVSFDIISFGAASWNWIFVFGISFVMLIQLQLLHWGKRVPQLVRFSALLIVLSDAFLIFFFIGRWHNFQLEFWIYLSMLVSVILTFIGLILLRKQNETTAV